MNLFGELSSVLLNDILVYKLPNCKAFRDEELCTRLLSSYSLNFITPSAVGLIIPRPLVRLSELRPREMN